MEERVRAMAAAGVDAVIVQVRGKEGRRGLGEKREEGEGGGSVEEGERVWVNRSRWGDGWGRRGGGAGGAGRS